MGQSFLSRLYSVKMLIRIFSLLHFGLSLAAEMKLIKKWYLDVIYVEILSTAFTV